MTQIEQRSATDPLKPNYEALTLEAIAQRPDAIASRQRVTANQALSPEAREARIAELMARVQAQKTRIPAGN